MTLAAYGPLYDASDTENYMEHWHKVRALERALFDVLKSDDFEPINKRRPDGRPDYDADLFDAIRSAFAEQFPQKQIGRE